MHRWHKNQNTPDDATAARLAVLARLDPDSVVAAMHAQRAGDDEERARWQRIARRLEVTAAAVVCAVLSLFIGGGPDGGALLALGALALPYNQSSLFIHCAQLLAAALGAWWLQRAVLSLPKKPPREVWAASPSITVRWAA